MEKETLARQKENEVEYLELVERLRQQGYEPEAPAFGITWGELAQTLAGILSGRGQTVSDLSDENLNDCMQRAQEALKNQETLPWEWSAHLVMSDVLAPAVEPDNDDEGPLTEEYENWSRMEDGWLDSAFEDRFELGFF